MISISAEDLVDCTAAVSARFRVGIRPQTSLVAATCNKAGVNLDDINLSRSTVHRKRFKKIEILGDKLRQEIIATLKGKKQCVHFDGKRIKQIEEDLKITVSVERIAVSVTSPDMDDTDDILLGVVQAPSSKGNDQAEAILNLLEYYDIVDQIFSVCCDTTASNTGIHSGAVVILSSILNIPLIWFLCRRHMLEIHISHFMEALTGEKTKGPRKGLYVKLQNNWCFFKKEVDKMIDLVRFDWSQLQVESPLYEIAKKALEFGKEALASKTFVRNDYRKLCELFVFYLGEVPGLCFHQPGACHEARFMADALYILTLRITNKITMIMSKVEKKMIETAAFFTSVCYAPWFLKLYLVASSPSNDLAAFKNAFCIKEKYPNLGSALVASMQRHTWYLTEQLVLLSVADDDVEQEVKKEMLDRLVQLDVPD
ncbi:uncharacterized protein LOC136094125 [Hydra vulgaris]|uniref:uncharacterized protein LOC136094125 n=1 Tax=Hydra vulgaris TaxID=6087 RepID=UPI0032EA1FD5